MREKSKSASAASAGKAVSSPTEGGELIAVISAAIAAFEERTVSDLIVRRMIRISGQSPAWNSAGRDECINSRRM